MPGRSSGTTLAEVGRWSDTSCRASWEDPPGRNGSAGRIPGFLRDRLCLYDGMASKQRLDLQLLTRGLAVSRQQAQQLIRAGKVRDGAGQLLDKPGVEVSDDLELQVEQPQLELDDAHFERFSSWRAPRPRRAGGEPDPRSPKGVARTLPVAPGWPPWLS